MRAQIHVRTLMIALAASIVATCIYLLLRQRDGQHRSLCYQPFGFNLSLFVGIGATVLFCLRQPRIIMCFVVWSLLVHAMRCLPPRRQQKLYLWVVDGPITYFLRMLAKAAYKNRMMLVPALTVAGLHGPIYLIAKGITTWYEGMAFSIAIVLNDPTVGLFAIAAFTTWRLLERKARRRWRRLRVFLWWEALFIGRRVVWNSIGVPFRNFTRELFYLWRTVDAQSRTPANI